MGRTMSMGVLGRLALAAMLAAPAGCGSFGDPLEAIGARVPAPDEFQVIPRKPLEMPATATLPEPTPGAPSPLEPDPKDQAIAALFGPSAVARSGAAGQSTGERALLSSANVAATSDDIRVQLEQDKAHAATTTPYAAPTLSNLLFGSATDEPVDETQVLDPNAEAQRLQKQGIAAPADPNAVATDDGAPKPVEVPMYQRGSPNDQIRGNQPEPAY